MCGSLFRQIRNELYTYVSPLNVIMTEKDLFSLSWLDLDFHSSLCVELEGAQPKNTVHSYKNYNKKAKKKKQAINMQNSWICVK